MPENRRKRPRDPAQLTELIADIAGGEVEDRQPTPEEQGKDPAAAALGRAKRDLIAQVQNGGERSPVRPPVLVETKQVIANQQNT